MTWQGDEYQRRFDALAAEGQHVHGEADFVHARSPRSVLDAGCGTGRVAIELASRGVDVVGVDIDRSMLETATGRAPDLDWIECDLATLDLDRTFDVVVMAGNVVLFTAADTRSAVVERCARHLGVTGVLVSGFQLGRGYDPMTYDRHCADVGLVLVERWATWDRHPFTGDADYAVSVHRSPA